MRESHDIRMLRETEERIRAIFSPLVVKETFDDLWTRMEVAVRVKDIADIASQVYFSWVLYTGLWAEAREAFWLDPVTAERYSVAEDAPADARKRLQWRDKMRWESQEQFIQYTRYRMAPRSTLWWRHMKIINLITAWQHANQRFDGEIPPDDFVKIVENVVLVPGAVGAIANESDFKPVAQQFDIPREIVERMVGPLVEVPAEDDPGYKIVAGQAILDTVDSAADIVRQGGRPADAVKEVRSAVLHQSEMHFYYNKESRCLIYERQTPPDDDGGIMPSEAYKVLFVLPSGEVVDPATFPYHEKIYLRRKFGCVVP